MFSYVVVKRGEAMVSPLAVLVQRVPSERMPYVVNSGVTAEPVTESVSPSALRVTTRVDELGLWTVTVRPSSLYSVLVVLPRASILETTRPSASFRKLCAL